MFNQLQKTNIRNTKLCIKTYTKSCMTVVMAMDVNTHGSRQQWIAIHMLHIAMCITIRGVGANFSYYLAS